MKSRELDIILRIKTFEAKLEISKGIVNDIDKYVRDVDLSIQENKDQLRDLLQELEMFLMSK